MPVEKRTLDISEHPFSFRKRQKVSLACDQCRTRKSKCDGAKPVCGECAQRGNSPNHCRYRLHDHPEAEHASYVQRLLSRIEELEHRSAFPAPSGPGTEILRPSSRTRKPFSRPSSARRSAEIFRRSPAVPNAQPVTDPDIDPVDGMGASQAVNPESQDIVEKYYGSSSAASFIREAYRAIGGTPTSASQDRTGKSGPLQGDTTSWTLTRSEQRSLPPRSTVDRVLECYWDRVYHLCPFVHRPTFQRAYDQLWLSNASIEDLKHPEAGLGRSRAYGPESIVFHCALNSMLAIASHLVDVSSDERQ